jgi:hypothetical protein
LVSDSVSILKIPKALTYLLQPFTSKQFRI